MHLGAPLHYHPVALTLVASEPSPNRRKGPLVCWPVFDGRLRGPAAETDTWLCCRGWPRLDVRLSYSDAARGDDEDKRKDGNCDYLHG